MLIEIKMCKFAIINNGSKILSPAHKLANRANFMWQVHLDGTLYLVVNESGNVIRK